MGILLKDKDYAVSGENVVRVSGGEELLDRVLFLLSARRGSFPFLPELGSRLYLLSGAKPAQWESLARLYVTEALAGEAALTVTEVRVKKDGERLWVETDLEWQGALLRVGTSV